MQNIWIVTTGNSDIQLNNAENWGHLKTTVKKQLGSISVKPQEVDKPSTQKNTESKQYSVPSRILAKVYGQNFPNVADENKYYQDLTFPLLDGFTRKLEREKIEIHRVILILSDQKDIFSDQDKKKKRCPYWQDTCENQRFFEKYFKQNECFKDKLLSFQTLKPEAGQKGLDDWNSVLNLVENAIQNIIKDVQIEPTDTVYLSHQAGTPAISSAVQFMCLAQFNQQVKFLVSNEYNYDAVEILPISTYFRKLQIQKAKKLIEEGLPGSALILLEGLISPDDNAIKQLKELKKWVKTFNIKSAGFNSEDEFNPTNAVKRIREALDLIEIFFKQENYLQGIALLSAAQETFLKAAIREHLDNDNNVFPLINNIPVGKTVYWDKTGLGLYSKNYINNKIVKIKPFKWEDLCNQLNLPKEGVPSNNHDINKNYEFKLEVVLNWLHRLKNTQNTDYWKLLVWSCTTKREHNFDRRNQLMHNLRGVEEVDVIHYLLGCPDDFKVAEKRLKTSSVLDTYIECIKEPFLNKLKDFGLWDDDSQSYKSLSERLQELADTLK